MASPDTSVLLFLKMECHRQTVDCCQNCLAYVGPGELSHLVQHCANQNSIPDCIATAGVIYFHIRKCLVAMISISVISCRTKMSIFTRKTEALNGLGFSKSAVI